MFYFHNIFILVFVLFWHCVDLWIFRITPFLVVLFISLFCTYEVLQQLKSSMVLALKKALHFAFYELQLSIYKLTHLKFRNVNCTLIATIFIEKLLYLLASRFT